MSSKINKVVIASDSFKECLTSIQVADAVEAGIRTQIPDCEIVKLAVADGGEGTVDALLHTMGGERVRVEVQDPLARSVKAEYAIVEQGSTAVIEMSSSCGLSLLSLQERNPMYTSTFGLGQIISDALDRGCRKFLIGIGGCATNDGGTGMLTALGWRFLDSEGKQLPGIGASLTRISAIDTSSIRKEILESDFMIACDVDSPFCGPAGAAYVYGPQKGATPQMVLELDEGMKNFAGIIAEVTGIDICTLPGAGAAGGLGGAFKAFMGAELLRGSDMVMDLIGFDECIIDADLIVTGEGKIDMQSLNGKLPYAVAQRAALQKIPVIAICGRAEVKELAVFTKIIQITSEETPLIDAMRPRTACKNIERIIAKSIASPKI